MMWGKKRCTILPRLFYRLVLALPYQHTLGQSDSGSPEPAGLKLRCLPDFPSSLPPLPQPGLRSYGLSPCGRILFHRSPDLQDQVLFFQTSLSSKTYRDLAMGLPWVEWPTCHSYAQSRPRHINTVQTLSVRLPSQSLHYSYILRLTPLSFPFTDFSLQLVKSSLNDMPRVAQKMKQWDTDIACSCYRF